MAPSLNIGENSFTMEQEIESLVPTFIKLMGREFVKWKRMQKAKKVALKCHRFRF